MRPDISVLLPARNEQSRLASTIQSIARARSTGARVEFVVVDDASTDDCLGHLTRSVPQLLDEPKIDIRVCRLDEQVGNYRARNQAAALASADLFFITDAHVEFSPGWDESVLRHSRPGRMLAATSTDSVSGFRAYGCKLLVPAMSLCWNRDTPNGLTPVQLATCHATVIPRELFERLGGYDAGMFHHGGGEPEFSVRAWLHGAEMLAVPEIEVRHRFKPEAELHSFLSSIRREWVHNCIRFGLLYLSELGCMQMLRYYARTFPALFQSALAMVEASDVWERRAYLETERKHPFTWYVERFGITTQIGTPIL